MSEDDTEEKGGIVTASAELSETLDKFALSFGSSTRSPKREAARFAMAVGIQKGLREKKPWKKPKNKKVATIAHLAGQFDEGGRFDFEILFEMLGLAEKETPIHHLISEYVTGGLRYIKDNQLYNLDEWNRLKDDFPHMFTQEE
tara:strand:- start:4651 stop:5082 length:432 start_codon:yes stop_codon:yes gene_type:complete